MSTTATPITQQNPSASSQAETKMLEKKNSFLGYMNGFFSLAWLGGMAKNTKTAKKAIDTAKNLKTVQKTAKYLKNIKKAKSIATWLSRIIKGGSAALAPFTGGTSLAVGLAAGIGLDLVVGEAIDAGITMANKGKVLDESKGDWIKLGDWIGQGLYNAVA